VTGNDIQRFLGDKKCSQGGKHAYYRCLKTLYGWLYSRKSGYGLDAQDNPMLSVDAPKVEQRIMPSLTQEQLDYAIEQADCLRDRAIISLFADTGLRLAELSSINVDDIDWQRRLIRVWVKGNRQELAVFGEHTKSLLQEWLTEYRDHNGKLWNIGYWGINSLLRRLMKKTKLPCNAHTYRRTFASCLAKKGVNDIAIMKLGRWRSLSMVERYTRSVKFEDALVLYQPIIN
jgi:site-specific recombinase XerD